MTIPKLVTCIWFDHGEARTPFMRFGDRVRMEARALDGTRLFGAIDQRVVKAT